MCKPSDLIRCSDETAAYLLNRAVWLFGSFVENQTTRFQHADKAGKKKDQRIHPKESEVREYRRSLIEQTPYSRKRARPARRLSAGGKNPNAGRKIVQTLGGSSLTVD